MSDVYKQAALPSVVNVLEAVQQFLKNLGTDPVVAVAKLPGAFLVLQGELALQAPVLVQAEFGAVMGTANSSLASMIAKAKAAETPPAA